MASVGSVASAERLRRVAWWVSDYAYAGWWQLRSLLSQRKAKDFASGLLAPVLIVAGVYEPWRFMLPLIIDLHERGHPVHVIDPLRNNRMPVPTGARVVEAYLAENDLQDVAIVAHSKGGLIGKHVMSFGDELHRIRAMVAIATPFGGSRYARVLPGPTLRSFAPGDKVLALLAGSLDVNARIVSVFASFDPHIPEGSELVGARNVQVQTGGHFRILNHQVTFDEVRRVAAGGSPAPPGTHPA